MSGIYLLITVCALLFIGQMVANLMEEFLVSQRTQTQSQETARMALEIGPELNDYDGERLFSYVQERAYSMNGRILLLDMDAVVQVDSASQHNGYRLPYREVRDVLVGVWRPPTASIMSSGMKNKPAYYPGISRLYGPYTIPRPSQWMVSMWGRYFIALPFRMWWTASTMLPGRLP